MKARGQVFKVKDNMVAIRMSSEIMPKYNSIVEVIFGDRRTVAQNALYWVFLTWCMNNGLRELGCLHKDELHETLRDYLLAEKVLSKGILKKIKPGSSAELDTKEFTEYHDACDKIINTEYGIDTSLFWQQYSENYT